MTMNKDEVTVRVPVILTRRLKAKLDWFIHNYKEEISGWLIGETNDRGIVLEDILIPYQEVSGVSVDTTGGDLARLREEYKDLCKKIVGHWHSHHSMGAFWSGTDESFITQHMVNRDLRVFIVSSTTNGHRVRVEIRKPFFMSIDNIEYEEEEDTELGPELQKEIDKKVKKSAPLVSNYSAYGGNYYQQPVKIATPEDVEKMIKWDRGGQFITIDHLTWNLSERLKLILHDLDPMVIDVKGTNYWSIKVKAANKREYREIVDMVKEELSRKTTTTQKDTLREEFPDYTDDSYGNYGRYV